MFPPPQGAGTHKRIGTKIKHYTRYSQNHDISAPKGCYIQLEKKTAKYILDNIQSSYLFALPNHLDYFEYEELKIVRIYHFFLSFFAEPDKIIKTLLVLNICQGRWMKRKALCQLAECFYFNSSGGENLWPSVIKSSGNY